MGVAFVIAFILFVFWDCYCFYKTLKAYWGNDTHKLIFWLGTTIYNLIVICNVWF